jgi:hypothetical protein
MANAGTGASGVTFTLTDTGTGPLPSTTPLSDGNFTPTFYPPGAYSGFSFAPPAPAAPYAFPAPQGNSTLNGTFGGDDPGGEWDLYAMDFLGGNSGQIQGGWNLTITPAETFTNPNPLGFIPGSGVPGSATAFPSQLPVAGLPGNITKLTMTINGLNSTCPPGLALLLQSPQGQLFVPMNLVATCSSVTNVTFTIDDFAALPLPLPGTALVPGVFRPASYSIHFFNAPPSFAPPAPPGPYQLSATDGAATFASIFNGTNPNGTWNLWVSRGIKAAFLTSDPHARLLACGITAMVVVQALMNISVVLALMPTKGIPLPFISYGGSSLFVTLASVGVLLNITQSTT